MTGCQCQYMTDLSHAEYWCGTPECPRCGLTITSTNSVQRVLLRGGDGIVRTKGGEGIDEEATLLRRRDIMGADEPCELSMEAMRRVMERWPEPDHPNLRERYERIWDFDGARV